MRFFLFLILISIVTPSFAADAPEELRNKARAWAFNATSAAMKLDYKLHKDQVRASRLFMTKKGCETFVTAMENYDLYDQVKDWRNSLRATLWDRKIGRAPIEQIVIEREFQEDNGLFRWKIMVPLKVDIISEKSKGTYNYLAVITMMQTNDPKNQFMIDEWHTILDKRADMGIIASNVKPERQNLYRPECAIKKKKRKD